MRFRIDPKTGRTLVLNEKTGRWVQDRKKAKGFDFDRPMNYMPDLREFVANATDKPTLISSRSQLARYERANNIRQCGDYKPGEIQARRARKVRQEIEAVAKVAGVRPGNSVTWSDFS